MSPKVNKSKVLIYGNKLNEDRVRQNQLLTELSDSYAILPWNQIVCMRDTELNSLLLPLGHKLVYFGGKVKII